MRALMMALCLLSAGQAFGETLYVRPKNACGGAACGTSDGTSYANAYDGFADIVWGATTAQVGAGDTLYVCNPPGQAFLSGSKATGAMMLQPGASGVDGSPIVIDGNCSAQGASSMAKIDGENVTSLSCLNTNSRSFLQIKNLEMTRCTSALVSYTGALKIADAGSDISADNIYVHDNNGVGIDCLGNNSSVPINNVRVTNFRIKDVGSHGLAASGACTNFYYRWGSIDGTGTMNGAHGITFHPVRATVTGWSGAGPVYQATVATPNVINTVVRGGAQPFVWLTKNIATPSTPGTNEFGTVGTTLYVNLGGTDPATQTMYASADDVSGYVADVTIKNTYDYYPLYVSHEGHALAFDDMTSNVVVERIFATRFEGYGVSCNRCQSDTVRSSIFAENTPKAGSTSVNGFNSTGRNVLLEHNTFAYLSNSGVTLNNATGPHTHTARNNISAFNGGNGFNVSASPTGLTASNNLAFGNAANNRVAFWTETSPVTANPKFRVQGRARLPTDVCLDAGSPAIAAGTYLGHWVTGYANEDLGNPPAIGARGLCAQRRTAAVRRVGGVRP